MTLTIPPSDKMVMQLKQLVPSAKSVDIDYDEIFCDLENNVRFREGEGYNDEELGELAASIESVGGLLQAVGVVEIEIDTSTGNRPYMLLYGYRRFLAWGKLREQYPEEWGTKPISAILYDRTESDAAIKIVQIMENLNRKALNPMEIAAGIQEALNDTEVNLQQKQVAALFGISEPAVSQHLKLLQLPASIQQDISSGALSFSAARILVNKVPPDRWVDLAKVAKSKVYAQFVAEVERLFSRPTSEDGEAEAGNGEAAGDDGKQKQPQLLRASEISNTYIPFVKARVEKADGTEKAFTAKDLEQAKLDALKTVTRDGSTALAKEIAPFIAEQEQKEEEEKARKKAETAEKSFWRKQVKAVEDVRNSVDATDLNAKVPTPAEAIAAVAKRIKAMPADEVSKLEFKLDVNDSKFFESTTKKLAETYKEVLDERSKATEARKAKVKEKEEEEKKKATEAGAAAAPVAAAPAAATTVVK